MSDNQTLEITSDKFTDGRGDPGPQPRIKSKRRRNNPEEPVESDAPPPPSLASEISRYEAECPDAYRLAIPDLARAIAIMETLGSYVRSEPYRTGLAKIMHGQVRFYPSGKKHKFNFRLTLPEEARRSLTMDCRAEVDMAARKVRISDSGEGKVHQINSLAWTGDDPALTGVPVSVPILVQEGSVEVDLSPAFAA